MIKPSKIILLCIAFGVIVIAFWALLFTNQFQSFFVWTDLLKENPIGILLIFGFVIFSSIYLFKIGAAVINQLVK